MDQKRFASEVNNVTACEAFKCHENAVDEIKVNVGKLGFIKLMVCSMCKEKFADNTAKTRKASSQDEDGARSNE